MSYGDSGWGEPEPGIDDPDAGFADSINEVLDEVLGPWEERSSPLPEGSEDWYAKNPFITTILKQIPIVKQLIGFHQLGKKGRKDFA